MISNLCPCGRILTYQECCGLAHANPGFIKTAEQLMRSRYAAFTMANGPYLIETHHPETRKNADEKEIVDWAKSVKWERLEISSKSKGLEADEEGTVEFKAYFREKGKLRFIHENSIFKKEFLYRGTDGVWKYFGRI
jgi:SEC-C motif-containing protein